MIQSLLLLLTRLNKAGGRLFLFRNLRSISLSNSDGFIPKLPAKSKRAFREGLFSRV
jgi:hypothetical protein